MKKHLLQTILLIVACSTIYSCHKDGMKPGGDAALPSGLYILNDGTASGNSASVSPGSLSFYNFGTKKVTPDQFNAANGKTLGSTGYDMEIYGSKMYITINKAGIVDIVNAKTTKLIKEVTILGPQSSTRCPKNIAFYKGSAYISCDDGTVAVMDTVNFSITATIAIKNVFYLGGLVVQNDKLYVADSGVGTGVNDFVSVIDLSTNKEIKRINVIPYPVSMTADSYGNVYVISGWTDDAHMYDISIGGLSIIDSKTDSLKSPLKVSMSQSESSIPITTDGDLIYYATGSYTTGDNKIALYNAKTQTLVRDNFVTDGTNVSPSSICVNHATGEVYITNLGSTIDVFDQTGKLKYAFSTNNPASLRIKLLN